MLASMGYERRLGTLQILLKKDKLIIDSKM
jgi:hypothetical protein